MESQSGTISQRYCRLPPEIVTIIVEQVRLADVPMEPVAIISSGNSRSASRDTLYCACVSSDWAYAAIPLLYQRLVITWNPRTARFLEQAFDRNLSLLPRVREIDVQFDTGIEERLRQELARDPALQPNLLRLMERLDKIDPDLKAWGLNRKGHEEGATVFWTMLGRFGRLRSLFLRNFAHGPEQRVQTDQVRRALSNIKSLSVVDFPIHSYPGARPVILFDLLPLLLDLRTFSSNSDIFHVPDCTVHTHPKLTNLTVQPYFPQDFVRNLSSNLNSVRILDQISPMIQVIPILSRLASLHLPDCDPSQNEDFLQYLPTSAIRHLIFDGTIPAQLIKALPPSLVSLKGHFGLELHLLDRVFVEVLEAKRSGKLPLLVRIRLHGGNHSDILSSPWSPLTDDENLRNKVNPVEVERLYKEWAQDRIVQAQDVGITFLQPTSWGV